MTRKSIVAVLFAILLVSSFAFPATSPELTRLPYLQNMTSSSVLIAWRTNVSDLGGVEYKGHGAQKIMLVFERKPEKIHHLVLRRLKAGATYWYRILEGNERHPLTDWIWFKTFPSSPDASFTFAVLGDSGNGSIYQKKVAHQLFLYHPDLVLHTGDVIYGSATDEGFDRKFFSIYGKLAETTPFFPSIGNHDFDKEHANPYLENFYLPDDSPGHGEYYSFTCAGAHFIALDSNQPLGKGSVQYAWLREDLAADRLPLTVVYFHHPLYSSGYHGSDLPLRKSLEPLFVHFRVALVFNGHDHDYERSLRIHGVTYVVTGGGGGMLYPVETSAFTAYSATVHNFVFCQVTGGKIKIEAIDDNGRVFDRDTVARAAAAAKR